MSRNFVLALMIFGGLIGAWRHFHRDARQDSPSSMEARALNPSPIGTVIVYGRDNCANTQKTLASLSANEIPVTYVNIDFADTNDAFHKKFDGTGLDGDRGYALPVVEIAGRASMRPNPDMVVQQFRSAQ